MTHFLNSCSHNDPVFILELHYIADCGKRCKFHKHIQTILERSHALRNCLTFRLKAVKGMLPLQRLPHRLHELICHDCAAYSIKRICILHPLGIHYGQGLRENFLLNSVLRFKGHLMMICYDHLHPQGFCIIDLAFGRDSVITGQDQLNSILRCVLDQMLV